MTELEELYSDRKDILFELKNTRLDEETKAALRKSIAKINVLIAEVEKGNKRFFSNSKIAKGATMSVRQQKQATTAKKSVAGATAPKEPTKKVAGFHKKGLSKKAKAAAEKAAAEKKAPKAKAAPKEKTPKATFNGTYVSMIDEEKKIIEKIQSIAKPKAKLVTIQSVTRYIAKAITQKQIRQKSKYGNFIYDIYTKLVQTIKEMIKNDEEQRDIVLSEDTLFEMKNILSQNKIAPAVVYLKQFIAFEGKNIADKKLASWLKNAKAVQDTTYQKELQEAIRSVENALQSGSLVEFTKAQLHGLQGLGLVKKSVAYKTGNFIGSKGNKNGLRGLDCACQKVNSMHLDSISYKEIIKPKQWNSILGEKTPTNVAIMAASREGQGKTTFALTFARDFVKNGNGRVAYISSEQFGSPIFTEQVNRIKAANPAIDIFSGLHSSIGTYDLIIIDSTNDLHLTDKDIEALRKQHPNQAFLIIVRQNHDGSYRGKGATDIGFDVDITIELKNGVATNLKNRCGACGEMDIFGYVGK